jgi:hypothetical protein
MEQSSASMVEAEIIFVDVEAFVDVETRSADTTKL